MMTRKKISPAIRSPKRRRLPQSIPCNEYKGVGLPWHWPQSPRYVPIILHSSIKSFQLWSKHRMRSHPKTYNKHLRNQMKISMYVAISIPFLVIMFIFPVMCHMRYLARDVATLIRLEHWINPKRRIESVCASAVAVRTVDSKITWRSSPWNSSIVPIFTELYSPNRFFIKLACSAYGVTTPIKFSGIPMLSSVVTNRWIYANETEHKFRKNETLEFLVIILD